MMGGWGNECGVHTVLVSFPAIDRGQCHFLPKLFFSFLIGLLPTRLRSSCFLFTHLFSLSQTQAGPVRLTLTSPKCGQFLAYGRPKMGHMHHRNNPPTPLNPYFL